MKMDDMTAPHKRKCLDRHLVAGCSLGHKPCLLHDSGWDMDQTEKSKYTWNTFFQTLSLPFSVKPNPPEKVAVTVLEDKGWPFLRVSWEPPHKADTRSGWITLIYELRIRLDGEDEWEVRSPREFKCFQKWLLRSSHLLVGTVLQLTMASDLWSVYWQGGQLYPVMIKFLIKSYLVYHTLTMRAWRTDWRCHLCPIVFPDAPCRTTEDV